LVAYSTAAHPRDPVVTAAAFAVAVIGVAIRLSADGYLVEYERGA
jgi:hypothetical protein